MTRRMRMWPAKKRAAVLFGVALGSWLTRHVVMALTTSTSLRLAANLVLIALVVWVGLAFFRTLLRESEEAAKENPRPW